MGVLLVLLSAVLVLLGMLLVGDLRTDGGVRRALLPRTPPLDRPDTSPPVSVVGTRPDGARTAVALTGEHRSTLLLFLGSACVTCADLWRDADREARSLPRDFRIIVVTRGPQAESARLVAAKAPRSVPVVMSEEAWNVYGVRAAPAFVVVDGATGATTSLDVEPSWLEIIDATRMATA